MLPGGRSTHQLNLGGIERKEIGVGQDMGRRKFLNLLGLAPIAPIAFPRNEELVAKGEQISQGGRQNVEEINRAILAALKRNPAKGVYSVPGVWYDIRDYGIVVEGGDITKALQATIDEAISTGLKRIVIPAVGTGTLTCGAITWSGSNWLLELQCQRLLLTATLVMPQGSKIRGNSFLGGGNPNQWPPGTFVLTGSLNPGILIDSVTNCTLEGLQLGEHSTACKVSNASCITIERCIFGTDNSGGISPLIIDSTFWVNIRDVLCVASTNAVNSGAYAAEFIQTANTENVTGLINAKNMLLGGNGIYIHPTASSNGAGSGTLFFEDLFCENLAVGKSLVTLDSSSRAITQVYLTRPGVADAPGAYYIIKNTGSQTHGVLIHDMPQGTDVLLDPTSTLIHGLSHFGTSAQPYTSAMVPVYAQQWGREWPESVDKILVSAPRGPQYVVGTALNVLQDPTTWDHSPTTGQLAPDGSTFAAINVSNYQQGPKVYDLQNPGLAIGDWYIMGCWVQAVDGTNHVPQGALPTLDLSSWTVSSSGCSINGGGNNAAQGTGFGFTYIKDGSWIWSCAAFKVTGIGSGICSVKMLLNNNDSNGVQFRYFNPCLQYLPVALGWKDADVINAARSYKGGWASGSVAGDVSVLDHQNFRAKKISTPKGSSTLTIATGVVTAIGSYHLIDTEAAAASDDLDTISGGIEGQRLVIRAANSARTVVAKDGTGNLQIAGDFSMDNAQDTLELIYDSALSAWLELGRSDNGA